jgi:glycosyltransferase involved in cell wall biosynthesis
MKRVDIIVEACTKLNLPLTVVGRGPDLARLQSIAGPTISFLTNVSDQEMPHRMAAAEAFIFASYDDFGITPVEALATGTPVIAYRAGGALDYVAEGVTGQFFAKQTAESLVAALQSFDAKQFNAPGIRVSAQRFSVEAFKQSMQEFIAKHARL